LITAVGSVKSYNVEYFDIQVVLVQERKDILGEYATQLTGSAFRFGCG